MSTLRSRIGEARQRLLADDDSHARLDALTYSVGALHAVAARSAPSMRDAEFRCYSQFGEDGIIQWLIARVPIERELFVEFGVESYRESNTRFLLMHDDWAGLVLDAGTEHIDFVMDSDLGWRHTIVARQAFITRDNINELLADAKGDVGLLSIDLDGNDYWVWEAVDVVSARIVVIEFNSLFGPNREVSVPYDPSFDRTAAHPSWLYWGASLAAMESLGRHRGYRLIGTNIAAHNAFFVREDCLGELQPVSAKDAWRESRYRESRDADGRLSYVSAHSQRRRLIADMPLVDVSTGAALTVGDLS